MQVTRREFAGALTAAAAHAATATIRVGITTNTRGGWEKDVWLSFREAHAAGYRHVESFYSYFRDLSAAAIKSKLDEIGVSFVTLSNSGPMEMRFHLPEARAQLLDDHVRLAKLNRALGCAHLKINTGPRRSEGPTTTDDLKHMAATLDELGRRTLDEGIKLAVHPHMWLQLENRREIDFIAANTDPKRVWFVLDTGHITMAGIDPVALAKTWGHRALEFHLKDTFPATRGGAKTRIERNDPMTNPVFFALGKGGVDFPSIKRELDAIGWSGWWTVELDSSPDKPPKQAAIQSREYLEKLGLKV